MAKITVETVEKQLNHSVDTIEAIKVLAASLKDVRVSAKGAKLGLDLQHLVEDVKALQVSAKEHQKETAATLKQLKKAAK